MVKLREVEAALGCVQPFDSPKYELEQYPTSAHLASRMMFSACTVYGDIDGKCVLDLGCGTGMLALAAELLGAAQVVGLDIDADALRVAEENKARLFPGEQDDEEEEENSTCSCLELINADVFRRPFHTEKGAIFDTVVMNPPFGTRTKGADVNFLSAGLQLSKSAVYSMHKTSTREFLQRKAKEWGVSFEVIAELRFDIPKMYKFHKKESADVQVDLIRLCKP